MKRIVGRLLIAFGVILISSITYINYNVSNKNNKAVEEYKSIIENPSASEGQHVDTVGVLEIPKINLEVIIKKGTSQEVLKNSVGHFEESAMPGEIGNFAIAGHRNYTSNKFFSNLDKVEIGDELNVLSQNQTYKYRVNSIEVVEPERVEVIDSTDKKEITLVTCTPKYVGSHRLIVKGEYIE